MRREFLQTWTLTIVALSLVTPSWAWEWTTDDLELFDLVEEINMNFYDLLGVERTSNLSDIKKAYRKLSLQLHPDKNKAEDASEKFRQLVSVHEVLKDEQKRQRYDLVLDNGLPDWRQPVFYYRRVRKMGLLELSLLLCAILTVGQYLVVWSIYFERKLSLEENFASKRKKEKKGKKNRAVAEGDVDEALQEVINSIPRPRLLDLWPIRLVKFFFRTVLGMPEYLGEVKAMYQRWREKKIEELEEEEEDDDEPVKRVKRRHKMEIPEYSANDKFDPPVNPRMGNFQDEEQQEDFKQIEKGEWTDEDYVMLSKAVAKFPGGTQNRWEKIAEMVERPVTEVTMKVKAMKSSHVMNVDVSLQGNNPKSTKSAKKAQDISDSIISKKLEDNETYLNDSTGETLRKRNKTKPVKTAERTLMISKQSSGQLNETVKSDPNSSKGSAAEPKSKISNPCVTEATADMWTQNQQMVLEWALKQYPKTVEHRWEKIAEHIPGKNKEDCITRFRHLVDIVKKRKQEAV